MIAKLDIAACICEIAGMLLIIEKLWFGFPFLMVGNILWFTVGKSHGLYGLMACTVLFFIINIIGVVKWLKT